MSRRPGPPEESGENPHGAVRARMVSGAVELLATRGVEGASFGEVLKATGSPRGSIYHHFPGGKAELLHSAIELSSQRAMADMEPFRGDPSLSVVEKYFGLWRLLLEGSDFGSGCSVAAVTIAPTNEELTDHAGQIFQEAIDFLGELLIAGGTRSEDASRLAATMVIGAEGAVVLCRALRDIGPLETVEASCKTLLAHAPQTPQTPGEPAP